MLVAFGTGGDGCRARGRSGDGGEATAETWWARAGPAPARPRRMMEPDPDLPGLAGLWRGERGLGWRLFVQGAVTIMAVLAVITVIATAAS